MLKFDAVGLFVTNMAIMVDFYRDVRNENGLELSFSLPKYEDIDKEYERVVKAGATPVFPPKMNRGINVQVM